MKAVWTVARRELRAYFDQPTAYVLIVAFLGLTLFLGFRTIYALSVASLRPIFDLLPVLFAIFVPAATMRSLAEERRGRTLEWLLAQPISETELVLGKFLGDWMFVMLALAGTLPTAVGLLLVSDADPGIMVAQYLGAAFLAAQFVSIGLWASGITRNQITAFIVGAATAFLLFLIGQPVVQIALPSVVAGWLERISVVSHFENVARGVVDLRDVVYFVSTCALFLVLTLAAVMKGRLSLLRPEWQRLRVGVGVVAVLVLMVNLLGSNLRGRIDLTSGNLYTLEEGTRDLLSDLDDLVQIRLFASSELPPELQLQLRDVRDLVNDMVAASNGQIEFTEVNPDDDPEAEEEATALGIYPVEFNVLRDDEFQVRRGFYGLAVIYADESEVIPVIERTDDLEFRLASAVYGMTTEETPRIVYAQGFGAKRLGDVPGLMQSLGDRYDMRALDLSDDSAGAIPRDSTDVVVVAGPTQELDSAAVQRVRDFIDAGGGALLLLDPVQLDPQSPLPRQVETGLEPLLEERGVRLTDRMVIDLASSERVNAGRQGIFQVIAPYPPWPIALPAQGHAITTGINALTLGWAAAFEITDTATVDPLWTTSRAGAFYPIGDPVMPNQDWSVPEEELGVRTLAVAITPPEGDTRGRLVAVGDASFLEPQFLQANPGNLNFLANAIDWLAQDESLIRIRSKNRTPPTLVFESDAVRNILRWGNLVGVPLLFVIFGVVRIAGRRARAERRWGEVVS